MTTPIQKRTFHACLILALALLLGGCAAHYGIKGHRAHYTQKLPSPSQYPTLTLEVGQTIRAVTPAKGLLVGGYWLAIYIENPDIAQSLPRKGDFFKGTNIKAIKVGKTKAYYGNAVHMLDEQNALENFQNGPWFWIEVVEAKEGPPSLPPTSM